MTNPSAVATGRLLVDPPGSGVWNMAVDEAILETARAGDGLVLRHYGWTEPTLSIGYFQRQSDRQSHQASTACRLVRRTSGGGAILHDRELTYSLCVPPAHPLAIGARLLYQHVHEALIAALAAYGVTAELQPEKSATRSSDEPFLCFRRRMPGDVIVSKSKVAGSAQRRCRGAVLQHGSVLLRTSTFAPELPGLEEVGGRKINASELVDAWTRKLEERLGSRFEKGLLSQKTKELAHVLAVRKYGGDQWTARR